MTQLVAMDKWLFHLLYDPGGPVLMTLAVGITHLGSKGGIWLLMGLALALFGRGMNRRVGMALATALAGNIVFNELLFKRLVGRIRPWQTEQVILHDTWVNPAGYAFPSGHSVCAFACAWVLGVRFPRWRAPLLALAALIALSRVVVGAHYPADVLAGSLLGLGGGWLLVRAWKIVPGVALSP